VIAIDIRTATAPAGIRSMRRILAICGAMRLRMTSLNYVLRGLVSLMLADAVVTFLACSGIQVKAEL
jgi:hypothetical protein